MLVNTKDIQNTVFKLSTDEGESMEWSAAGRSAGLNQIKTYLLPSASGSENVGADTFLVFIPSEITGFEVDISRTNDSGTDGSFGIILAGQGIPTTVAKGHLSSKSEQDSTSMLEFSKDDTDDTIVVTIDSEDIETIQNATLRSTTLVEPTKEERYEVKVVKGLIDEVKVVNRETSKVVYSLKSMLKNVNTPLRVTEIGDGLNFSKFLDGSVQVESPDEDLIFKALDAGYKVSYSDGTSASFEIDSDGSMVGVFSDGSTSIRFEDGGGIHSTADGWVINEEQKGIFEVFREGEDGALHVPSIENLSKISGMAQDAKDMMRSLLEESKTKSGTQKETKSEDTKAIGAAKITKAVAAKFEFLKQVTKAVSTDQNKGASMQDLMRNMLEAMQTSVNVTGGAVSGSTTGTPPMPPTGSATGTPQPGSTTGTSTMPDR